MVMNEEQVRDQCVLLAEECYRLWSEIERLKKVTQHQADEICKLEWSAAMERRTAKAVKLINE
tara:strand:+ start:788 stop:976 length:189 start_codon:yes stop_codon:yes gene_type:complete